MNTFTKYASLIGVGIVFSVALPVYAEDQSAAPNKIYPSAKPMVAKGVGAPRAIDSLQEAKGNSNATTASKKNAEVPDPSITPYVTYEGATSSNTDR